ncbi:MAG: FMN-binding protein [Lachnospiraceae bacterium]|nr:FMN-binding protein [Lachnospiraceae bacterium]
MKRALTVLLTAAMIAGTMAGCGGSGKNVSYKDGTYTGVSETHENEDEDDVAGNGYGMVEITIKDNVITDCVYTTYELDGTQKDENYGKGSDGSVANRDYYNKAQKALAACEQYAVQLVETNSLDEVDAISGATINYEEFKQAVTEALKEAQE